MTASRPSLFTPPFRLLWIFNFLTFFAAFQLFPAMPLHLRDLGANLGASGGFMSAFTAGSAAGALFTGSLGDRLGQRRMLVACGAGFALFLGAYALVSSRILIYLLAVPHGVVWSGLLTAMMALMGAVIPESRRVDGMSIYGMAGPAGVVVGPVLGLWGYRTFGFGPVLGVLAALFLALSALGARMPAPEPAGPPRPLQLPEGVVLLPCIVYFGIALGYGAVGSFTAQEALALGLPLPSVFLSAMAASMLLIRLVIGLKGFGRRPVRHLPGMVALSALGLAALAFLPGGTMRHALAAFLYAGGYSMVHTLVSAYVLDAVDPARRGAAFGATLVAFDAGIGSGSLLLGGLIGAWGYRAGWAGGALAALLVLPAAVAVARRALAPRG